MKHFLHHRVRYLALLAGLAAVTLTRAAEGEVANVLSPAKRQEIVDTSKKLLAHQNIIPVKVDPFHPEAFNEVVAAMGRVPGSTTQTTPDARGTRPAAPRNEHDVLQSIAAGLKPSGFYTLSGQPTLVFGQKRVKAGGNLTITFEGTEYTLEITTIAPPNFTLRLNREEFTRTIK